MPPVEQELTSVLLYEIDEVSSYCTGAATISGTDMKTVKCLVQLV